MSRAQIFFTNQLQTLPPSLPTSLPYFLSPSFNRKEVLTGSQQEMLSHSQEDLGAAATFLNAGQVCAKYAGSGGRTRRLEGAKNPGTKATELWFTSYQM